MLAMMFCCIYDHLHCGDLLRLLSILDCSLRGRTGSAPAPAPAKINLSCFSSALCRTCAAARRHLMPGSAWAPSNGSILCLFCLLCRP